MTATVWNALPQTELRSITLLNRLYTKRVMTTRSAIDDFRYRPDIDGLRAVAVLAVVLFHAEIGCTGGYVGVDVFFVISGFLITSLIWKDIESGHFSLIGFWEKRARRIVPAVVVVTMVTLAVGWYLMLPSDFAELGKASAAQATFSANVHYWLSSGYFTGDAEQKPLLHTWSLAVEEQFYLVVPVVLWAIARFRRIRNRKSLLVILAFGWILSFSASVLGVRFFNSATFYLLPTRAWELLMGSILAFVPSFPSQRRHSGLFLEIVAACGMALIVVPVIVYTPQTPFPGLSALWPCFGTALLIWANRSPESRDTFVSAMLAKRPVVFVGLISYSFYLWHWPLFAFTRYSQPAAPSLGQRLLLVLVGFVAAIFSWKYVETPFRKRKIGASRTSVFAIAGVGLFSVFAFGLWGVYTQGFPSRFSTQARAFDNAKLDMHYKVEVTKANIVEGNVPKVGQAAEESVFVWGDSHIMAAMPAIESFVEEYGVSARVVTRSSTAPTLNWYRPNKGLGADAISYNEAVLHYIQRKKFRVVILNAFWRFYSQDEACSDALVQTVKAIAATGATPVVLLDVPTHSFDIPKMLGLSERTGKSLVDHCTKPAVENRLDGLTPTAIRDIRNAGGMVLDPKPYFLDPTETHYVIQSGEKAVYCDDEHLTTHGAIQFFLPFLREQLGQYVSNASSKANLVP